MFKRPNKRLPPQLHDITDPGHLGFDYRLRLSQRRTASIQVRAGEVTVAAPLQADRLELQRWVDHKADWVRQKLQQQVRRQADIPRRRGQEGELWPWLGERLQLSLCSGNITAVNRRGQQLQVRYSSRSRKPATTQVLTLLEHWYRQQALQLLRQKTLALCEQLQRNCVEVRVRRTRSKWGHCTRAGIIQYNWLIVQAPEWVVDYLVVHECCHLVHHNHSRAYWQLVASLCPDYQHARDWLKTHGHRLTLTGPASDQ